MIKYELTKYTSKFLSVSDKVKLTKKSKKVLKEFEEETTLHDINSYVRRNEIAAIIDVANYIRENCDVFLVIGIGGSYMGSKAVIEALLPTFNKNKPEIIYLGTDLSSDYYKEVIEYVKDKDVIVNVISKSGTTLETTIAFDIINYVMMAKYDGEELKDRIIITTDAKDGPLRKFAKENGYFTFEIPKKIGGRFSVFTPAGLLPIAVAGIDIIEFMEGFVDAKELIPLSMEYAITREALFNKNKYVESFTVYNSKLYYFTEWLKQLFAETQGKNGKGILPISAINTRDLHSLGQFMQDGHDIVFETVIGIERGPTIRIEKYNKTLNDINRIAQIRVCEAHYEGKTPSIVFDIEQLNARNLGILMKFFMNSSILGAMILDVDPYNQPGVDTYKKLINKSLNDIFIF